MFTIGFTLQCPTEEALILGENEGNEFFDEVAAEGNLFVLGMAIGVGEEGGSERRERRGEGGLGVVREEGEKA